MVDETSISETVTVNADWWEGGLETQNTTLTQDVTRPEKQCQAQREVADSLAETSLRYRPGECWREAR